MKILLKNWEKIFFLLSLTAILFALSAEYFFNLIPCKMCLHQRYPYYVIILLFILIYFFKNFSKIWFFIISEFAILYGLFYSIWHVGIENKIIKGNSGCTLSISNYNSLENLKDQILKQDIVDCSEVSWIIFGFSAATINLVLLLLFLLLNTMYIYNKYYAKKY